MSLKVLLVDDHRMFREGLRALLEGEGDIQVVAEAENGRDAVRLADDLEPNIVIMDISMPDLNGVEATRQITKKRPGAEVIVLSVHSDRHFVEAALRAGAAGYLLKEAAFQELILAVRTAADGQTYLSPGVAHLVVEEFVRHPSDEAGPPHDLSDREREVLQLLAEGHATKQIARRLHVSVKTVESHRHHIMEKLNLHSVPELTKYAVREGLTSLEE